MDAVSKYVFHLIAGQTEEVKWPLIWVFCVVLLFSFERGWSFREFKSSMGEKVVWEVVGHMYGEGFRRV